MILRLHVPSPPLSEYIEMLTYYEDYSPGHSIERLLPEGVIEIIIDMTEDPKYIYDNHTLATIQSCRKSWISGMRSRYISISVVRRAAMFVIRFSLGKAWQFLQMPVDELDDQVVDAEQVFGSAFASFRQSLMEVERIEQKFTLAEEFILQRLKNGSTIHPAVEYAIDHILQHPSTAAIKEIVGKTGYSHKHLLSLFGKYAGLTPKRFLRIVKFQHAIQAIERQQEIRWSHLAHDCGYYDQAHFINDFKEFSGFTPNDYLHSRSEFVNYVPVR